MSAKVRWWKQAWWVVTHADGRRYAKRIGSTRDDKRAATRIAEEINAHIALGTFKQGEEPKPQPVLFADFARLWLQTEVEGPLHRADSGHLAPMTVRQYESNVRVNLIPAFGELGLTDISSRHVQEFADASAQRGLSPRSIEKALGVLRTILDHARASDLLGENPVRRWTELRPTIGRRRSAGANKVSERDVFSARELRVFLKLVKHRKPDHHSLVVFLAHTGARFGEALALRWMDVDLDERTARICRSFSSGKSLGGTKTGRTRLVELSDDVVNVLRPKRPDVFGDDALVFPNEAGRLQDPRNFRDRVFRPLVRKIVGVRKTLTVHSLRHTFASLHMARATPIKWVQAQGGWASAKMLLDVYGHFVPEESGGYANALSASPDGTRRHRIASERPARNHSRVEKRAPSRTSLVAQGRIELPTRGFSVRCSTN